MKLPEYTLNADVRIHAGGFDAPILVPKGSFIQPMKTKYVPKHVKEQWPLWENDDRVYCFTRYGILPIPESNITKKL